MPTIQFREALRAAMTEEMERDENVFLMGEEVAEYNGAYKVSEGMLEKFGPRRIFDTPISEAGVSGLSIEDRDVGEPQRLYDKPVAIERLRDNKEWLIEFPPAALRVL